jgi:hypothetical protein
LAVAVDQRHRGWRRQVPDGSGGLRYGIRVQFLSEAIMLWPCGGAIGVARGSLAIAGCASVKHWAIAIPAGAHLLPYSLRAPNRWIFAHQRVQL